MGIILILGAIAFLRSIGWLGLLGMIAGGILTYVNQGGRLVAWSQVVGLAPVPAPAEARPPRVPPPHERWAKLVAGLLCLLAGLVFTGFGTWRFIEANSLVTDSGCTHPCGMVNGLWVQVMPGTHGEVVTRTDAATVRILVRFWDDAPGDRVVSSSDFVLGNSHTAFDHVTSAPGCATWTPHTIRIDEHTDDMTLCFAIAQRDEVDLSQLSLVWTQQAGTVRISLGQAHSTGYLSIGETPSPLHP